MADRRSSSRSADKPQEVGDQSSRSSHQRPLHQDFTYNSLLGRSDTSERQMKKDLSQQGEKKVAPKEEDIEKDIEQHLKADYQKYCEFVEGDKAIGFRKEWQQIANSANYWKSLIDKKIHPEISLGFYRDCANDLEERLFLIIEQHQLKQFYRDCANDLEERKNAPVNELMRNFNSKLNLLPNQAKDFKDQVTHIMEDLVEYAQKALEDYRTTPTRDKRREVLTEFKKFLKVLIEMHDDLDKAVRIWRFIDKINSYRDFALYHWGMIKGYVNKVHDNIETEYSLTLDRYNKNGHYHKERYKAWQKMEQPIQWLKQKIDQMDIAFRMRLSSLEIRDTSSMASHQQKLQSSEDVREASESERVSIRKKPRASLNNIKTLPELLKLIPDEQSPKAVEASFNRARKAFHKAANNDRKGDEELVTFVKEYYNISVTRGEISINCKFVSKKHPDDNNAKVVIYSDKGVMYIYRSCRKCKDDKVFVSDLLRYACIIAGEKKIQIKKYFFVFIENDNAIEVADAILKTNAKISLEHDREFSLNLTTESAAFIPFVGTELSLSMIFLARDMGLGIDIVSFSKGATFNDRQLSLKFSSQKANP